ncbi:hypothetical protein DPMN_000615 [Dreissena polymorpha]|uniref:Uncharacterized protein n=1 Tax=Dreissena polymorpha TaxID=45954 RepID=A0A9D4RS69_DREPO|nr:hypothetical protein DPMN_000615 [Dreissena polymorpha]
MKYIIGTNLLTKVFTANVDGRRTKTGHKAHLSNQRPGSYKEQVQTANAHGKYQANWSLPLQVIDHKLTGLQTDRPTDRQTDQRHPAKQYTPWSSKGDAASFLFASGGHVFVPTGTIFNLFQDIIAAELLNKFHADLTINVPSRVLTRFYYGHIRKNAPPPGRHVFQATRTIFKLIQDTIGTNLLNKKNAWPSGGHVFQQKRTSFDLIQDIIRTNVLTKFYYSHIKKNAPPPGSHVFHATNTIIKLVQDITGKNLLTKSHEDWTINMASRDLTRKNAPPPGGYDFQPTIFKLIQDNIGTNLLTKFQRTKRDHKSSP